MMATINNESISKTTPEQVSGTTVFLDDAPMQMNDIAPKPQHTGLLPIRDQAISDFLAKPQLLAVTSWSASQVANVVVYTFKPETALLAPVFADKISGFRYIRATAVVRMVINAEPFHAGKLIMSFIPCHDNLQGNVFRDLCLNQVTQHPNVEIDCRESMCMMRIPYITPADYFDLATTTIPISWGKVDVHVLSPLKTGSGGISDLDVSIFVHFEDVELAAPTLPQSGLKIEKRKNRPARARAVPITAGESEALAKGPLSSALMTGAHIAEALASMPMLAPVATPASWVARGLSGVASWFGWSKPMVDSAPTSVARRMVPNMANATGSSLAPSLGLFHDTSLTVLDNLGGVPQDEMSFLYLKSIKAYTSSFTMNTTQTSDTALYNKSICPTLLGEYVSYAGSTHGWACQSYPPGFYLANYFKYWKGGVRLHLKIAKTDYHSGRILITFTPGNNPTAPTTAAASVYSLREIVDIRQTSEFVMDLPYLLNTPYQTNDGTSGFLKIIVLNELRAPAVVANSIDFVVYYSCCDDFEVAAIDGSYPNTSGAPKSVLPFYPQAGSEGSVEGVIGGYVCGTPSTEDAEACVGECFTSVKQLMTRYTKAVFVAQQATSFGYIQIPPFFLGGVYSTNGTGAMTQSALSGDALSAFASGYAFMRGSVKLLMSTVQGDPIGDCVGTAFKWEQPESSVISSYAGSATQQEEAYGDVFSTPLTQLRPVQHYDPTGLVEVSVPYYNRYRCSLVDSTNDVIESCKLDTAVRMPTLPRTVVGLGYESTDDFNIMLRRSTGEDFQLGYFLGFPPILTAYAAN